MLCRIERNSLESGFEPLIMRQSFVLISLGDFLSKGQLQFGKSNRVQCEIISCLLKSRDCGQCRNAVSSASVCPLGEASVGMSVGRGKGGRGSPTPKTQRSANTRKAPLERGFSSTEI